MAFKQLSASDVLAKDLHGGGLVVDLAKGASVRVELNAGAAKLGVGKEDGRGAGANTKAGHLVVAAKILKGGLALIELPASAAKLLILEAAREALTIWKDSDRGLRKIEKERGRTAKPHQRRDQPCLSGLVASGFVLVKFRNSSHDWLFLSNPCIVRLSFRARME